MQATPPPLPPPRKSKSVWLGTTVTILIVAVGIMLLWPKREPQRDRRSPASAWPMGPVTKGKPFVNSLGMKFVQVPIQGGPSDGQLVLFSVWDTRVEDYEAYHEEIKTPWMKPDFEQGPTHPAVNVSWTNATLFCQWLTLRELAAHRLTTGWCYRLPSDHEWSCAVGIGEREDAGKLPMEKDRKITDAFPWGTQWPPPDGAGNFAGEELQPIIAAGKYTWIKNPLAGYRDHFVETAPVGSFPGNRFGLFDLGGNVVEWCEDFADERHSARVLRGADWHTSQREDLLSSRRYSTQPISIGNSLGFRCVIASSERYSVSRSVENSRGCIGGNTGVNEGGSRGIAISTPSLEPASG